MSTTVTARRLGAVLVLAGALAVAALAGAASAADHPVAGVRINSLATDDGVRINGAAPDDGVRINDREL